MIFTEILRDLCDRTSARGAVMVDRDGELVASWPEADFDMALIGAHCEIILDFAIEAASKRGSSIHSVLVSTDAAKLMVMPVKEGYCLVAALSTGAPLERVAPVAAKAVERIEAEMG